MNGTLDAGRARRTVRPPQRTEIAWHPCATPFSARPADEADDWENWDNWDNWD
eukprot:SAG31_NODE_44633_length_262_cov_0.625767_1_plen_52_part_10